jgi:REP element-mobilizing transposase RayT
MSNDRIPFEPGCYYHLYNHGNSEDDIFRAEENYCQFLSKYAYYINAIAETYAFSLMPNHFHFLIRMKEKLEIEPLEFKCLKDLTVENYNRKIAQQWSNFFNSYAKSFNKQYDRRGSLFLENVKRKKVEDEQYFRKLIHYNHANPVMHGFVKEMRDWKFSSYHSFLSDKVTYLKREEVLDWFGGMEQYREFHRGKVEERMALDFDFY